MCISIRDLFEFGKSVLSVLFSHYESWGLVWLSLHSGLNRVTNVLYYVGVVRRLCL